MNTRIEQLLPRFLLRLKAWMLGIQRLSPWKWRSRGAKVFWNLASSGSVRIEGDSNALPGLLFLGWLVRSGNWTKIVLLRIDPESVPARHKIILCFYGRDSGQCFRVIKTDQNGVFGVLLGPSACQFSACAVPEDCFFDGTDKIIGFLNSEVVALCVVIANESDISSMISDKIQALDLPPIY